VSPQDKAPYSGFSFTSLRSTLRNIKTPTWYASKHGHHHPCALRPETDKRVEARYEVVVRMAYVGGLRLNFTSHWLSIYYAFNSACVINGGCTAEEMPAQRAFTEFSRR